MRGRRGDGAKVMNQAADSDLVDFGERNTALICREIRGYVPPGLPFLES